MRWLYQMVYVKSSLYAQAYTYIYVFCIIYNFVDLFYVEFWTKKKGVLGFLLGYNTLLK